MVVRRVCLINFSTSTENIFIIELSSFEYKARASNMYKNPSISVPLSKIYRVISRSSSKSASNEPLYLNPNAWKGLPPDRIFELHNLRKEHMGEKYVPSDDERNAILSTYNSLGKVKPTLDYAYEIDNFKERHMNNTPINLRGLPPKRSNINVIGKGATPHQKRKIEQLVRVSAYEMPLLAKFRQPYNPSPSGENPLKLIFSTDFSSERNSSNRKVQIKCNLKDLNLNETEERNLKLLAGNKFDYHKNEIHFSSDSLPEATQNARQLVDTFNRLLKEAKTLNDEFADIPLDKRHMKPKRTQIKYIESWKRPEDAPLKKYKIVSSLVQKVKSHKDENYIAKYSP
ncbi:uncharacterized protein PRCAT00000627001 [Priceomyces carsonii]|uniref:uncharacterized protein n=1 Tax=Priceomyces carsonii TaxID=28549 RepID=UPI002EDAE4D5|nr:unnamed protein product [Priceomyces carsonii]